MQIPPHCVHDTIVTVLPVVLMDGSCVTILDGTRVVGVVGVVVGRVTSFPVPSFRHATVNTETRTLS